MKITFQRFDREKMAAEALLSGNRLSDGSSNEKRAVIPELTDGFEAGDIRRMNGKTECWSQ